MSLPNYLAKIKSAGIYRFVWDKSVVPPQQAETLRLLVGYSNKGPFNTPVYIETVADFRSIFGNISKRLERKGVYFHRMAEQALASGPILALNLKPFGDANSEKVSYLAFDGTISGSDLTASQTPVKTLYNTNRFWKLDENELPGKLNSNNSSYFNIATTDTLENSCSILIKKNTPDSYNGITLGSWYASQGIEYPEYMEKLLDEQLDQFFADIYVFRGQFTDAIMGGPLKEYFNPTYEAWTSETATHLYDEDIKDWRVPQTGETATHIYDEDKKDYRLPILATHIYDETAKAYRLPKTGETATHRISGYKLKEKYVNVMGQEMDGIDALAGDTNSNFVGVYSGCTIPYFKDANGNYISLDIKFNADHASHKMMMKLNDAVLDDKTTADQLKSAMVIDNIPYSLVYLPGYTYSSITSNAQSGSIWSQCKAMISSAHPGIVEALTNRVDVEYHYVVDTFDSETTENKAELFALAKAKDNAFAIVNFPKMSKFGNVDAVKKGNTNVGAFKMPDDINGASFGAYYTQLTFSDGALKTVIPSAALVSNLFMTKWTTRQPYYIVAGPNFGALSYSGLVGPDYNFSRKDLDVLEPMGINAIIYVPRLGTYISSNQTAKQVPVSGLSKVHIRELVIYLQNEVEHLLQSYQWELNTQPLRDTIKAKADAICDTIKNNGGIYAYVNVCDETNNTPEVIDNEMIILDTEIEPARGAGKMVHQLTIHKTGGLTSSVK